MTNSQNSDFLTDYRADKLGDTRADGRMSSKRLLTVVIIFVTLKNIYSEVN